MPNICVIGAGVVGLSTALNIQKRLPCAKVRIIAEQFGKETTSYGAGGIFRPNEEDVPGVPKERLKKWSNDSWNFYSKMALSSEARKSGHEVATGYYLSHTKLENVLYRDIVFSFKEMSRDEMDQLNFKQYRYGYQVTTVIITARVYINWLLSSFQNNGGKIEVRRINNVEQLMGKYDAIVNCTGLGSKALFSDTKMYPMRGQMLRITAPWIKFWVMTSDGTYMLPNKHSVVIGGTHQKGNDNVQVDPKDSEDILARCQKLLPFLKGAKIQNVWVGLRPVRQPVRLEKEELHCQTGVLKIIHNYGHGRHGIGLSWGTSVEAAELVEEALSVSVNSKL